MTLVDTDLMTLYFHDHPRVSARIDVEPDVATTVVSRIEILRGRFDRVLKAADAGQLLEAQVRLADAERRLAAMAVVGFNARAAAEFDRLRVVKSLRKIGRDDLLIACIALSHRAEVATRNLRDFGLIPGLRVVNWFD